MREISEEEANVLIQDKGYLCQEYHPGRLIVISRPNSYSVGGYDAVNGEAVTLEPQIIQESRSILPQMTDCVGFLSKSGLFALFDASADKTQRDRVLSTLAVSRLRLTENGRFRIPRVAMDSYGKRQLAESTSVVFRPKESSWEDLILGTHLQLYRREL